jgi:hypothetical protein
MALSSMTLQNLITHLEFIVITTLHIMLLSLYNNRDTIGVRYRRTDPVFVI